MSIRHKQLCSYCQKEFEWIQFTAQRASDSSYDVVSYEKVGHIHQDTDGSSTVTAKCEHCRKENSFKL